MTLTNVIDSDTSYSSNTVTITSGLSLEEVSDDDESGTNTFDVENLSSFREISG
jgi:hypothetical protein